MRIIYDNNIERAATDGEDIFINPASSKMAIDIFTVHETGHIRLRHKHRRNGRDTELWNYCADIEIAQLLYPIYGYNEIINNAPTRELYWGGVTFPIDEHPEITEDMTAEEIYDILKSSSDEIPSFTDINPHSLSYDNDNDGDGESCDIECIRTQVKSSTQEDFNKIQSLTILPLSRPSIRGLRNDTIIALRKMSQNALTRHKSYMRPSRRYHDNVSRGHIYRMDSCNCAIFVDCSGSFSPEKTKLAEDVINELRKTHRGAVRYNVFFFSDNVGQTRDSCGSGRGTNYQDVFNYINVLQPHTAIIITDNDLCDSIPKLHTKVFIEIIGSEWADATIVKEMKKAGNL